jgi:imidazolonepropionase-like amidohydrolase
VKQRQLYSGTATAYALAKKYRIKTAWGSDVLFDSAAAARQGMELAKMTRWFTLGVVEEGALADLILVNGNPVENLNLVADPEQNFVVIMKDGKIYKNTTR